MAKHEGMWGIDPAMKTGHEEALEIKETPPVTNVSMGKNKSGGNIDLPTSPHGTKKRGKMESDY